MLGFLNQFVYGKYWDTGSTVIFPDLNFKKCINNLDANLYIQNQPYKRFTHLKVSIKTSN